MPQVDTRYYYIRVQLTTKKTIRTSNKSSRIMDTRIENFSELKRGLILWTTILNLYALFYHQEWYVHTLIWTVQSVNFVVGVSLALWMIHKLLVTCWLLVVRLAVATQVCLMAVLFWYGDLAMNDAPWDFLSLEVNGVC